MSLKLSNASSTLMSIYQTMWYFQGSALYFLEAQVTNTSSQMYVDAMVWYFVFIIFVMYCIMPMPFKW